MGTMFALQRIGWEQKNYTFELSVRSITIALHVNMVKIHEFSCVIIFQSVKALGQHIHQ